MRGMAERPRLLVLDLLETFAREQDMDVHLERHHERDYWVCALMVNRVGPTFRGDGGTARDPRRHASIRASALLAGVFAPRSLVRFHQQHWHITRDPIPILSYSECRIQ